MREGQGSLLETTSVWDEDPETVMRTVGSEEKFAERCLRIKVDNLT